MAVTRDDLVDALTAYWGRKTLQLESSRIANAVGAGTAGSVRGGKQFDPVAALVAKFFSEAGFPASSIRINRGVDLPGYFRPSKQWDVVVVLNGILVAAFELKAYDSVCYLVSSPQNPDPQEPVAALNWAHFAASVRARIHYMAELGYLSRGDAPRADLMWSPGESPSGA